MMLSLSQQQKLFPNNYLKTTTMNNLFTLVFILIASQSLIAQALVCPDDQIVEAVDYDTSNDYGEPIINTSETYTLDVEVYEIPQSCDMDYFKIVIKEWTLTYGSSSESCQQTISVGFDSFDNYAPPADTILVDGNINNIGPEITGYYGPESFNYLNIISAYEDIVIDVGAGFYKIIRTWTLVDWCDGSTVEHNQIIKLEGDTVLYGGEVTTGNGQEIQGYTYQILNSSGQVVDDSNCAMETSIVAKLNCLYDENPGESLELKIVMPGNDYLNGVSTLDAVLIQRHILGLQPLSDHWQIIAADVNNNQSISAIDLIEQRKLILGIYDVLPANSSWKFFNADIDADLVFSGFDFPLTELQIIGVKIGDVNYSATP